ARPEEILRAVLSDPLPRKDELERGLAAADVQTSVQLDAVCAGYIDGVHGVHEQRTGLRREGEAAAFDVHIIGADIALGDGKRHLPFVHTEAFDRARLPRGADVERAAVGTAIVEVAHGDLFVRGDAGSVG